MFHLVEISRENEYTKTKCWHVDKLEMLLANKKEFAEPDLSGEQLKKWVRNIFEREPTLCQKRILAEGLNYAVSQESIPVNESVVATKKACCKLPVEEAD